MLHHCYFSSEEYLGTCSFPVSPSLVPVLRPVPCRIDHWANDRHCPQRARVKVYLLSLHTLRSRPGDASRCPGIKLTYPQYLA